MQLSNMTSTNIYIYMKSSTIDIESFNFEVYHFIYSTVDIESSTLILSTILQLFLSHQPLITSLAGYFLINCSKNQSKNFKSKSESEPIFYRK